MTGSGWRCVRAVISGEGRFPLDHRSHCPRFGLRWLATAFQNGPHRAGRKTPVSGLPSRGRQSRQDGPHDGTRGRGNGGRNRKALTPTTTMGTWRPTWRPPSPAGKGSQSQPRASHRGPRLEILRTAPLSGGGFYPFSVSSFPKKPISRKSRGANILRPNRAPRSWSNCPKLPAPTYY